MLKMTSAYASKLLKKLTDERNYLANIENSRNTYFADEGTEPVIPDYDYHETKQKISNLNDKIMMIRHAINLSNTTTLLQIGDKELTVDSVLIRMPQLQAVKERLDDMRKNQQKELTRWRRWRYSIDEKAEIKYANYNIEDAKADYDKISSEIMMMQLALDRHNQTAEFEVDIDL